MKSVPKDTLGPSMALVSSANAMERLLSVIQRLEFVLDARIIPWVTSVRNVSLDFSGTSASHANAPCQLRQITSPLLALLMPRGISSANASRDTWVCAVKSAQMGTLEIRSLLMAHASLVSVMEISTRTSQVTAIRRLVNVSNA